jgi:integrase/recombinase XerD
MNSFEESTVRKYEQILTSRNYSPRTVANYASSLKKIDGQFPKNLYHVSNAEVKAFLFEYPFTSTSMQNQYINALRLFYKYILNKQFGKLNIERPRREKHLPRVIDKETLLNKILTIPNLKHRAILAVAYSVGLRVSEVCNLKIADIDSKKMIINVINGKGRKDRIVPLSDKILEILRNYLRAEHSRPLVYLFEGQYGGKYSVSSCQHLYKRHIDSHTSFHTLRHSSFTSMLESGTDIRRIQKIAGHSNIKTTEIYTHISVDFLKTAVVPI